MEVKTVIGSGMITILAVLLIIGSMPEAFHTDVCINSSTYYTCDKGYSKYYGLPQGKCLSSDGNKLCRSGWLKIDRSDINNTVEPQEPIEKDFVYQQDEGGVLKRYVNKDNYLTNNCEYDNVVHLCSEFE